MIDYTQRLNDVIPGGAHTYSRGDDQFPESAPSIVTRGKGVHLWSTSGKWLDFGMGLRSVGIGYAENSIDWAARRGYRKGNSLTRPSFVELEAANAFLEQVGVHCDEMVKFSKNGSNAVSGGVKLARAVTGRKYVAVCEDHPFYSFDDWFIGSTQMSRGIPSETKELTLKFKYANLASLEALFQLHPGQIAVVVMEPYATKCPHGTDTFECCRLEGAVSSSAPSFVDEVQALCRANGTILLLDETITGNRFSISGYSKSKGLEPDLRVFGKAISNGYSVAALVGRRDIMEVSGITSKSEERVFLLSATHGAEMGPLSAMLATKKFYEDRSVVQDLAQKGAHLKNSINKIAWDLGLNDAFGVRGHDSSPFFIFSDVKSVRGPQIRSLLLNEAAQRGLLIPWIAIAYRHRGREIKRCIDIMESSLSVVSDAISTWSPGEWNRVKVLKPVFRRWN